MNNKNRFKILVLPIIFIALLTAIDQVTKFIITSNFKLNESRPVFDDIFHITYIRNQGAAWGMLQGKRILFLILTTLVVGFCIYILYNISGNRKYIMLTIDVIILTAGAIGNMIDRFKQGYVVDFLDFKLINFPVFNVADIYVTLSMVMIFILLLFVYKNDDLDFILTGKIKVEDKSKDEVKDKSKDEVKDELHNQSNIESNNESNSESNIESKE